MVKKKLLLTIIIPYDIYKYNYVNAIIMPIDSEGVQP